MTKAKSSSRVWKILLWLEVLVALGAVVLVFGGTAFALKLEENDAFCASCHTQPEVKYYQQSTAAPPTTLAAAHAQLKTQSVLCIDCHSGAGALGRVDGLKQGAQDLVYYLGGHYTNPAVTTNPLSDASCTKCHSDVLPTQVLTRVRGTRNHYHLYLPYWHQVDPNAARCVDCHTGHTDGNATDNFVNNGAASAVCESCHRALSGR